MGIFGLVICSTDDLKSKMLTATKYKHPTYAKAQSLTGSDLWRNQLGAAVIGQCAA